MGEILPPLNKYTGIGVDSITVDNNTQVQEMSVDKIKTEDDEDTEVDCGQISAVEHFCSLTEITEGSVHLLRKKTRQKRIKGARQQSVDRPHKREILPPLNKYTAIDVDGITMDNNTQVQEMSVDKIKTEDDEDTEVDCDQISAVEHFCSLTEVSEGSVHLLRKKTKPKRIKGLPSQQTKKPRTSNTDFQPSRRSRRKSKPVRMRPVREIQWEEEESKEDPLENDLLGDLYAENSSADVYKVKRKKKLRHEPKSKYHQSEALLFHCGVCDKSFQHGEKLRHHTLRHNHTIGVRCGKCNKMYSNTEELIVHARTHAVRPYQCDQCPAAFISTTHLKRHIQTHSGEKRFKCEQCPSAFHQLVNLKVHMRSHTGEKPYKCDQCPAAFTLSSNLKRHRRTHTGEKPYQCDVCNKSFSVSSQLKVHYRIHTGEKTYKCTLCPAAFIQSSSLKSHTLMHKGEKPYRCELCPAAFVESTNLKVHMRTHSGEKPFLCEQCPRAFTQSSSLKKHRLIHTGEKSFQCNHCPKTFRLPHGLRRHLEIHNDSRHFRCEHCPAKFLKLEYLRAHMFLHNGEKPWLKKKKLAAIELEAMIDMDINKSFNKDFNKNAGNVESEEDEEYEEEYDEEKQEAD